MATIVGTLQANLTLENGQLRIAVVDTQNRMRSLERTFNQTATSTRRLESYFLSFGTKFRHFVQLVGAARFAMMDFHMAILSLPQAVMKTSGEIERMTQLMKGLSTASTEAGRAQEAQTGVNFIFDLAKRAPFEIKSLQDAFVKLKSAGLDPMDGTLNALVDNLSRFGGTSEQMHRVAIAIQQMAGKGVISMEELRQQLGEAMPNAMRTMADGMGMSIAQMVKHISKGQVEARDALRRMVTVMGAESGGAAAAMMKTWVGLIALMTTQWELFKKSVGDQGFFDEAKKIATEIIRAFNGNEAKSIASGLGQLLHSALIMVRSFSLSLIENAAMIGNVVKALLVYFAVTRIGLPLYQALKAGLEASTRAFALARGEVQNYARDRAAATTMNAAHDAEVLQKQLANQQAEVVGRKIALREMTAEHARYVAHAESLDRLAARQTRGLGGIGPDGNRITPTVIAQTQALAAAKRDLAQKQYVANMQHQQGIFVLQQDAQKTAQLVIQKTALAGAMGSVGRMAGVMSGALSGIGMIFRSLGGWATVLTIGLTALIFKIWSLANATEDAANRARRAKQGLADTGDAKDTQASLDNTVARMEKIKNELDNPTAANFDPNESSVHQANILKLNREYNELSAKKEELQQLRKQQDRNILTARVSDEVSNSRLDSDVIIQNIKIVNGQKIAAYDEATKFEIDRLGNNDKAIEAYQKQRTLGKVKLTLEGTKLETRAIEEQANALNAQITAASADQTDAGKEKVRILLERKKQLDEQLTQYVNRESEAAHLQTPFRLLKGKDEGKGGGTGPLQSPIEDMLEGKEAELASLTVRFQNLSNDVEPLIGLKAEIDAKIDTLFDEGRFRYKDGKVVKNANASQITRLKDVEFDTAVIKKSLELRKKIAVEAIQDRPEIDDALARLADPFRVKDSGQFRQTEYVLERMMLDLPIANQNVKDLFETLAGNKRRGSATIDLAAFIDPLAEQTRNIYIELEEDQRVRRQKEFDAETKHQRDIFELYIGRAKATGVAQEAIDQASKTFEDLQAARLQKLARDMETPLQKIARDWKDMTEEMQDATVTWSNNTIEMIVESAKTGKFEVSKLLEGMLTDIYRMQLQKTMGPMVTDGMGKLGDWLLGNVMGGKKNKAPSIDRAEEAEFDGGGVKLSFDQLQTVTQDASDSISQMTIDTDDWAGSIGESVIENTMATSGMTTFTTSLGTTSMSFMSVQTAAEAAAAALMQVAASGGGGGSGFDLSSLFGGGSGGGSEAWAGDYSVFGAANGGLMTSKGMASLKKYRRGGIANSPQLAMFGEGSMNEAYVPLPDGRSIPVTMNGSNEEKPSVTVNVINQSGQQVEAKSNERFDGRKLILDVVLTAVSTPGPFRDSMKGAMSR